MTEMRTTVKQRELSRDVIEDLARWRSEPSWLVKRREEAWHAFERLPMPRSRYTHVRGLDLGEISPILDTAGEAPDVPPEFKALAERGEAGGLLVHVDGHAVQTELSAELKKKGVIFTDIATAVDDYPDLVQRHLDALDKPQDKMIALQRALFRGGPFLYVPKNVELERPLKVLGLLTRPGSGLFTQGFLVAERGSAVTYIEELDSPRGEFERPALESNTTFVHVGEGAQVNFGGVQNWNPNVFSFGRRWGRLERDARLRWALGWLGGRTVMNHLESVLDGPGADVEDVQVFFTSGRQHYDLTSNLRHRKPHTIGEVTVKGILKDKSRAVFWGLIRIYPGAQQANAYQSERSLILGDGPRSNAIPSLEIEADDVRCTHAASASQIDEEQIFYLQTRGLDEDEARKTIVDGFFEPTVVKIPLPLAQDRIRTLIDRKWRGRL